MDEIPNKVETKEAKRNWLIVHVASIVGGLALVAAGEGSVEVIGYGIAIGGALLTAHDIYDVVKPEETEQQV